MSDYYCTNCGADLELQSGFDPDDDHWTCTECGHLLTNPDSDDSGRRFEGVRWFCDECGACLDDQFGFSDWHDTWECTKCGHTNYLTDSEVYESEADYRSRSGYYDDEDEDDEDGYEQSSYSNSQPSYSNKSSDTKHPWGYLILAVFLFAFGFACLDYSSESSNKSSIIELDDKLGFSSESIIGMNYEDAVEKVKSAGFKSYNIETNPVKDVDFHNKDLIDTVSEISIDGLNRFSANDEISRDSDVVIEYHTYMDVTMPYSPSELKKMTYNEALVDLMNAGFINVEPSPLSDLKKSNKKEGRITEVTVDGDKKFKKETDFRADVEIIISYHSVMESDPEE